MNRCVRTLALSAAVAAGLIGRAANAALSDYTVYNCDLKGDGIVAGTGDMVGRLYVPNQVAGQTYPLVVAFHGLYCGGFDNTNQVGNFEPLLDAAKANNFFLFIPQSPDPGGTGWWNTDLIEFQVMSMVAKAMQNYQINPNKIYVTGISGGGQGSWMAVSTHSDVFAAAIPICGAAYAPDATKLITKPIWPFHERDDSMVPVSASRNNVDAIRAAAGHTAWTYDPNSSPDRFYSDSYQLRYTEYSSTHGWGHNIWPHVYSATETTGLYPWLLAQSLTPRALGIGETVLFDLGTTTYRMTTADSSGRWWNGPMQFTEQTLGPAYGFARITTGARTTVSLNVSDTFTGTAESGVTAGSAYDTNIAKDFWCTGDWANPQSYPGIIQLKGLTPGANYNVVAFGSTTDANYSPTAYTIGGSTQTLTTLSNTTNKITFNSIAADANGMIQLTVKASGAAKFGIINALELTRLAGGNNIQPNVSAGQDQSIQLPATASLAGTANDPDSSPSPLVTTWNKFSGPGNVTFGNANALNTTATFSAAGTYVLRLTANDGAAQPYDDVQITVAAANVPPSVNAGQDKSVQLPTNQITLSDATASDSDGPSSVSVTWSKNSGPGTVTFGNAYTLNTTATFSVAGTYELKLAATDGAATTNDYVIVTVVPAPSGSTGILAPYAFGQVGSTHPCFAEAFNVQPTSWDGTKPVGGDSTAAVTMASWENGALGGGVAYIDLGSDWQQWRLEQVWSKFRPYHGEGPYSYYQVWWDDDNDATMDTGAGNAVQEFQVNFCTKSLNSTELAANTAGYWKQDLDVTASPIVPKGRYLMLKEAAPAPNNQISEYALVGYKATIPPTTVLSISPGTFGQVGTTHPQFLEAFNNQPTWDGTQPVGGDEGSGQTMCNWENGGSGGTGYIDLGANYAKWRILQVWSKFRPWNIGTPTAYQTVWWDNDNDATMDTGGGGAVQETRLNFCTQSLASFDPTGKGTWKRDADATSNPIVPQGRYLMFKEASPAPTNQINEYVLIGYILP